MFDTNFDFALFNYLLIDIFIDIFWKRNQAMMLMQPCPEMLNNVRFHYAPLAECRPVVFIRGKKRLIVMRFSC